MTLSYSDLSYGNARAWVVPHPYADIAQGTIDGEPEGVEFIVDNLNMYGAGQLMFVSDTSYT